MQHLATIIREQIDTLVDQYDARLHSLPGYSSLPEAMRRDLERHFLNLIAESLEAGDYNLLVQYAQQRARQWAAQGLNLVWFQQVLTVPEELLVPLVQSVETSNFVWQALNRSQSVVWQMLAERTHQTEERFRSIVETAHSGIMIVDDQFHLIYANEQLTHISGYSQAELIGADFRQLLDEDSRRLVADHYVRGQQGEEVSADYEIAFIHKDGQKRYVEMSAVLLREASGRQQTVAQVLDVSDHKQSEQALRDSQQLLQSVMDNIPQAVFWKDRQLRYLGCNQAFAEDTGLNLPQIIVGKTDYDMPWRTQAELYRADDQHVMDSGAAKVNYEEQQTTPSGETTWRRTSKIPMHDADSNVIAVLGMYEDITEHKRVETALRENESRLRAIYEGSNDAIMLLNARGFFDCNSYTLKLFGVASKEEFIRFHPADLSPAQQPDGQDSQTASQQKIQIAYQQGHIRFEWVHRRVTGENFPAEVLLSAFEYGGEQVLQATVHDITERKQLEQRMRKSLELREQQVRSSTEVSQEIAAAPDLNELFKRVVTLIKERFNYYHAQIFRYDPVCDAVVLVTGYGEVGQRLLADKHQLSMGRGVVGTAAANGQSILATDVTQAEDWRPNPHLPDTKGELAVPIKLRDEVLGILDVQSDRAGTLSDDDRLLLEGLCGQIAIAINSKEAEEALAREQYLMHALMDSVPDYIYFKDRESRFIRISKAHAQAFGLNDPAQTVGKTDFDFFTEEHARPAYEDEQEIIRTGQSISKEEKETRPDQPDRWVLTTKLPLRDEADNIVGTFGMSRDITDRKQSELRLQELLEKVQQSEQLMRTLIDAMPDEIYAKDTQGRLILANTAEAHQRGVASPEMLISQSDFDFYPRELAEQYFAAEQPIYQEGQSLLNFEEQSLNAEGRLTWHASTKVPLRDNQGQIIGLVGRTTDITERKLAEAALAEERNRLRTLIDNLPVSVFIKDRDSRFMVNNAVHLRILGAAAQEEVSGKWDFDYFPQELAAQYYADEQELMRIGQPLFNREEFVVDQSTGKRQWALSTKVPLRDSHSQVTGFLGFTQDITERKLAEQALQRNEAELSEALRIAHLADWSYDVPTDTFTFNDQFYALMRTTAEREGGYTMSSAQYAQRFVHPEDAPIVGAEIVKALETTNPDYRAQVDHRVYFGDGELGYVTIRFSIEKDEQGRTVRTHGANQDITDRKTAEAELQRSEQLMRTLIDALPDHIYAKDPEGRLTLVNLAEARLHGVDTPEMLVGKSDFDFYPRELAEQYRASELPILRDGVPLVNHEEPNMDATGQARWNSTTKVPLRDNGGQIIGLVGITRDVTERKLAEAEREQILTDQQRRAVQLQTAAEVGRVATSILNPEQLLDEIVTLVAARFGFYHVAAFTVDESGRWAQLRAATGEVGQQLLDRGQALGIRGKSLVGNAIRQRQPRIALDVGPEAVHFDDPLLPVTRSEIALPLIAGDQVLGALDLHSTLPAAFDENSAILLQSMADQIAVALNTAEQYQREQAHVEQTNRLMQIVIDLSERTDRAGLQNRLVRSALSLLDTDRAQFWLKGASGLELKAAQSVRPGADQSLAISQELADRVYRTGLPLRLDSPPVQTGYASRITDVPFNAALMAPISWQGHTTGVLSVMRSQPGRPFTQDDENSVQLLAAQAAAALENITLAEQQQHRAVQLQTAAEVSQVASSILNLDALLPQAAELVRSRFDLYYVGIFLIDEAERWAVLRAGTGDAGQQMLANGHKLKIGEASMISQCIVKQQARIALDVGAEAIRFDNPRLPLTRSELALPLVSRRRVIGAVTIQSDQPAAFTSDDITGLQTMADQIGNAVENARLYEQSNAALQEVDALNRRLTGEAWESYLHRQSGQQVISVTDNSQTAPDLLPQLDGLLAAGEIVVEPAEDDQSEATVTAPILLRGQPIGALRMRTPLDTWDKDTEAVLTGIAGHIAQAVENARLIEQTQRTASRERAINEINARVRQTIDLDAILRTAVNELGQSLKAARVTAHINVADSDQSSRRYADMGSQPDAAGSPRGNDHD